MLIVHVHVKVKPENVDAFRKATIENASKSIQEPGIARFDVVQQQDDPTRFVLVEVYRTDDAPAKHKETAHYQTWREGGRADDGGTAEQREIRERLSKRRRLVIVGADVRRL